MKNTLGKTVILLFLFITPNLLANELATYDFSVSNKNPYLKEAVKITFVATQEDKEDVMFFFLEAKKSKDYKIILLNKDAEKLEYHHKKTTFTYLFFPLSTGDISIDFDFTIKVASDKAVAQVYEGSRDNVKWIETINTKVKLNPLILSVKSLEQRVDLVGDFVLTSKLDKQNINAYESANISYTLSGLGYDKFDIAPIDAIDHVDIFSDMTKHYEKATQDGYDIKREFNYALVSDRTINIEPKAIRCYSVKKEKYYTLKTQEYTINVKKMAKQELIDSVDFPKKEFELTFLKDFFIYMIIFLSGYITAKYTPISFIKRNKKYRDIVETTTPKELLYLLMHKYQKRGLEVYYEALNDIVYGNTSKSKFKKIKKAVLKELNHL